MKTIFERIESDSYDLSQPISKHFLSAIAKLAFEEGRKAGKQEVKGNLHSPCTLAQVAQPSILFCPY
jgi:hypothetical protein